MFIRAMAAGDIEAVLTIEQATLTPWSREMLVTELRYPSGVALVAELVEGSGRVVGWCAARLLAPEAELLKIAVDVTFLRQGIGGRLLDYLCEHLRRSAICELFLEVRAQNHPALAFYRRHGFLPVGKRPGYYSEPKDDALLFKKPLLATDNE